MQPLVFISLLIGIPPSVVFLPDFVFFSFSCYQFYLSAEIEPNEQQTHGLYNLKQRQWEWEGKENERVKDGKWKGGTVYVIIRETCFLGMLITANNAKLFAVFVLHFHCSPLQGRNLWKFCHRLFTLVSFQPVWFFFFFSRAETVFAHIMKVNGVQNRVGNV